MHDDATYHMSVIIQFHRCQFQDIRYLESVNVYWWICMQLKSDYWCHITKNNVAHGAHNEGYYLTPYDTLLLDDILVEGLA